jgi:integrase/recombinase XerC
MNALVPLSQHTLPARQLDAEGLIERWKEGRSPQTLRAYVADLKVFAGWMKAPGPGAAVNSLLTLAPGEANEKVRAWRSSMIDRGAAPATINRRLSALRSLVALAKEFGFIAFDLSTKNVRSQAYRDTRGPERDVMAALLEYAKGQPHEAKAARDVALFLLLGYGRALRRGEAVSLDLEHFDARGSRLNVLRKGRRERQWLSLDLLVTRKLQAWIALRGKEPGPLFLQLATAGALPAMASIRSYRQWEQSLVL